MNMTMQRQLVGYRKWQKKINYFSTKSEILYIRDIIIMAAA